MAFNSNTYHRNRHRRVALEHLERARVGKMHGNDPTWNVRRARAEWRMYLSYLSIKRCGDDLKRLRRGEMRHSEFMAKWEPKP